MLNSMLDERQSSMKTDDELNEFEDKSETMLTTIDNPFDPFTQFDEWYAFDESKGYHTCGYLARIAKSSDELSEVDEDLAIKAAIDEIVKLNVLGIYRKVERNVSLTKKNNNEV